eukprot:1161605-Pelagomonas_calceolata.AAC.3
MTVHFVHLMLLVMGVCHAQTSDSPAYPPCPPDPPLLPCGRVNTDKPPHRCVARKCPSASWQGTHREQEKKVRFGGTNTPCIK